MKFFFIGFHASIITKLIFNVHYNERVIGFTMTIVAFYSQNASSELQQDWQERLNFYDPSIKLVSLLSKEAEKATTALLWKAPLERIKYLKKLKGLISLGQGVDHILKNDLVPENIPVVRIVDPFMAKTMSHWVLLSILSYTRDIYGYYGQEKSKIYKPRKEIDFLSPKIAIYGIGEIGNVVLKDLYNLGFNVEGWSRTKKNIQNILCNHGHDGFVKMLKSCNIHVCLLPLTKSTNGIFNKETFSLMKKNSCFINAGRGDHVVEEDLLESCKTGHISNAILDVYKQEPLPQNHIFWKQENIRIWPHVAAETNPQTAAKQIANAIKCINEGKSPPNMVDKKLGY